MRPLNFLNTADGVAIATGALVLGLPPVTYGLVDSWNDRARPSGVVPEFRLEIWANAATNLTGAQLYGAAPHPLVIADDVITGEADTDVITAALHGLLTGDGPVRLSNAGGALPAGLAAATDYWSIRIDDNTFQLAASRADAMTGDAIDFTTDGTGTTTLSDTASTERVHWHGLGLLGPAGDGAVTLTAQLAYATRREHDPRTFAYALAGSLSASDPETVSAKIYPLTER